MTAGIVLYCGLSSLGLFLNAGFSEPLLLVWVAGFLSLAFYISYQSYISPRPLNRFLFLVLGVIALNLFVQVSGGIRSFLWSLYFLYAILVAAFFPARWAYTITGLILFVETANRVAPRGAAAVPWEAYTGYAVSLAGVTVAATYVMNRIRSEARQIREAHDRLLEHANAVDPLADESKVATLTREARQMSNVSAALDREDAFRSVIDIIFGFVPAHTYALFLKERRDGRDVLVLRGVRSITSFAKAPGLVLDMDHDSGVITRCAGSREPQLLTGIVIPHAALGYYVREVPVRTFLAHPIVRGDETLGVLVLDSLEDKAFSDDDRDQLERFLPFFIQIIDRIRLSQELDVRAKNFKALHTMSEVLNSSLELEDILNRLAGELSVEVPHDLCMVIRYDEKSGEAVIAHQSGDAALPGGEAGGSGRLLRWLRSLFGTGTGSAGDGRRFPVEQNVVLGQMLSQWRLGRPKAYDFDDLTGRSREIGLLGDGAAPAELGSLSCWPLMAREKFIGAFFIGSRQPHAFSEYQRNLLHTLMNQVAVVMDNVLLHRTVKDMALTDGLTGLLNHRTFMVKVQEEFERLDREPQPFSLLLLDIDFFKKINDTYGHPVGDVALRTVAGIIRKSVRTIDFVARYGGEEFAVGLVGADSAGAEQMAERIRKTVEITRITSGAHSFPCTISIGVATARNAREKREELITRADNALYHAKRSGRNRVSIAERLKAGGVAAAASGGPGAASAR